MAPLDGKQRPPQTDFIQRVQRTNINLVVQSLTGKVGQNEASPVDILVVIAAETLLLLGRPLADGLANVAGSVLAADHEANLAGGVGGDGGVGVFGDGEDLLAGLLEVGDQRKVQPLVLGCKCENANPNRFPEDSGGLGRNLVSFMLVWFIYG